MTGRNLVAGWLAGVCCAVALGCGGSTPASAPPPAAAAPPAPKVMTAAERADLYKACWEKFSTKAWDDFKKCYADTAEADPLDSGRPAARGADAIIADTRPQSEAFPDMRGDLRLVLVNGTNIAGVAVLTGTNSQPMATPDGKTTPATNKKIGLLFGHAVQLDDTTSKVTKESDYLDSGTMMAQLGLLKMPSRPALPASSDPATVVIATNSPTEAANVAAERKSIEDWNAHNAAAVEAGFAPDVAWHEIPLPKDLDRKGLMASLKDFWTGFSNVKLTASSVWGAGDYVVLQGTVAGTNDGVSPSMGIKKKTGKDVTVHFLEIDRFEGGTLKEAWLFYDSGAFAQQLAPPAK